ncbi:unnamed protein product [Ceutorhynchus assimilis]|uniref:Cytochrome P450 n=1 Tax=Ceutorhynchus assimilis TaxID=467358 RepID=A0A9N9MTK6_9CUCU|nr:unnamed protein product [Ceutorhynchus assimilis]
MESDNLKWLTVVILFLTWIFFKFENYFKSVILAMKLQGPATVPFFGNALYLTEGDVIQRFANIISTQFHGSISRIWLFFIPFVVVYKPEHLKIIMSSSKVSEKNFVYKVLEIFFCNGLITLKGHEWKNHRKIIQPFFQTNLIENDYYHSFLKYSQDIISELGGQKCVKIQNITNKYVKKILHRIILGVDLDSVEETPFKKIENTAIEKLWKPWKTFQNSNPNLKQSIQSNFYERKSQLTKNNCLLDKLIEKVETSEFTEDEAINEAITFLIAGYETIAITLIACLYYLAKNQNIQEKVYQEIQDATSNGTCNNITVEHINKMHYLGQCVKETLRIMPPIPLLTRVLNSDITLDNYTIPSGTNILMSPLVTHRVQETFPDPLKYDPDRFSKENIDKLPPYSYIPFSIGSRNCIAHKYAYLELKTIIACILKEYHIELKEAYNDLSFGYRVAMTIKGGVWFNINPRKNIVK